MRSSCAATILGAPLSFQLFNFTLVYLLEPLRPGANVFMVTKSALNFQFGRNFFMILPLNLQKIIYGQFTSPACNIPIMLFDKSIFTDFLYI